MSDDIEHDDETTTTVVQVPLSGSFVNRRERRDTEAPPVDDDDNVYMPSTDDRPTKELSWDSMPMSELRVRGQLKDHEERISRAEKAGISCAKKIRAERHARIKWDYRGWIAVAVVGALLVAFTVHRTRARFTQENFDAEMRRHELRPHRDAIKERRFSDLQKSVEKLERLLMMRGVPAEDLESTDD